MRFPIFVNYLINSFHLQVKDLLYFLCFIWSLRHSVNAYCFVLFIICLSTFQVTLCLKSTITYNVIALCVGKACYSETKRDWDFEFLPMASVHFESSSIYSYRKNLWPSRSYCPWTYWNFHKITSSFFMFYHRDFGLLRIEASTMTEKMT